MTRLVARLARDGPPEEVGAQRLAVGVAQLQREERVRRAPLGVEGGDRIASAALVDGLRVEALGGVGEAGMEGLGIHGQVALI